MKFVSIIMFIISTMFIASSALAFAPTMEAGTQGNLVVNLNTENVKTTAPNEIMLQTFVGSEPNVNTSHNYGLIFFVIPLFGVMFFVAFLLLKKVATISSLRTSNE